MRRINKEFIPVALKAGMVNNPPRGMEGQLYAEIPIRDVVGIGSRPMGRSL